jgi:glycerol-3-phosphate O-acyltransferase
MLLYLQAKAGKNQASEAEVISTIVGLPTSVQGPVVKAALVPGGVLDSLSQSSLEKLHPVADLSDKDMKKALQKASDSPVPSRRATALQTLVMSVLRCQGSAETLTSALAFVAKRIQNEVLSQREAVLGGILRSPARLFSRYLTKERLAGDADDEDKHSSVRLYHLVHTAVYIAYSAGIWASVNLASAGLSAPA